MTDRDRFLSAIAADPNNDTARLAYADFLDEHGSGPNDCARAEFIRVQMELANWQDEADACPKGRASVDGHEIRDLCSRRIYLEERELELLKANEMTWRAGPVCEECRGTGTRTDRRYNFFPDGSCQVCAGTGDVGGLFYRFIYGDPEDGLSSIDTRTCVPCIWHRGFIHRVDVPSIDHSSYWEWIRTVLSATPERAIIAEVVPRNRNPRREHGISQRYVSRTTYDWRRDDSPPEEEVIAHDRLIPIPVFDEMVLAHPDRVGTVNGNTYLESVSPEEAISTLGRAVAAYARRKIATDTASKSASNERSTV